MDDLISRQALCEYALNQKDKSITPNDIMRFPSAQPEIIRCRDCKHFAEEGMYCACDIMVHFDHFYCYYAERKQDG